ncbi:MAG: M55 family metallopeptidase [Oscillospiraceae bacterium]|nr:M55 family metallopeptidase [Oscillospiraceae bacterium]
MKKIYIHTDLEGISGIDKGEMVKASSANLGYSIKRLMTDVNAAIDGAFEGGATHVTVLDSHGGGGNFDLGLLDKRAQHDTKPNKKWWGIIDGSYFGTFFIGAHAMAGTLNGFLDHTQSSEAVYNYYVNGRKMGELGQWAMVCAHYDVPMIMVSGDEAAVHEATQFFGDIETACVKKGISRENAALVPADRAVERIRRAAKAAVEKSEKKPAFKPLLPMEIKIEYTRADYCDYASRQNGTERVDARTARKISGSYQDFWI